MIILTTSENLEVVVKESDVERGSKNYLVRYCNVNYDPSNGFKATVSGKKPLWKKMVDEYINQIPMADMEFDKRYNAIAGRKGEDGLMDSMKKALIGALCEQTSAELLENVMPEVKKRIVEEFGILPQKHEVLTPTSRKEIKGTVHEKFDTVLNLVNADIPCFLTGPAGTGKNVICKQIAEALDLDFYFTNAVTQEYKLTGFIDAHGVYHVTEFYKAFKNGGLFFLDEMDASIPETLIVLNAAIANRYFDFPNGKIEAHEDFRVIGAGNTYGTGADIEYTGRYQLDSASLDRFAVVEVDYSKRIEEAMAGGDDELVEFAEEIRKSIRTAGIRHLVTYRAIDRISKLKDIMPIAEVLKMCLYKNLENDDINVILNTCNGISSNRYYKASKEVTR